MRNEIECQPGSAGLQTVSLPMADAGSPVFQPLTGGMALILQPPVNSPFLS
jgi:hypothetical protein